MVSPAGSVQHHNPCHNQYAYMHASLHAPLCRWMDGLAHGWTDGCMMMSVHMHASTHMGVHWHASTHMYQAHICTSIYMCTHAYEHKYVYTSTPEHICAHMHMSTCVCMVTHKHICLYRCPQALIYVCMHASCMQGHVHADACKCTHQCMYACMQAHMCVYTCMCPHIHVDVYACI
jgi:hypothetical protein